MFDSTYFLVIAVIAITLQGLYLLAALFGPGHEYKVKPGPHVDLGSEDFFRMIAALTDAFLERNTRVEVLTNGEAFYEAELEAIRKAQHSINLEAYIFQRGEVTRRFLEAMTERARAGVQVNVVIDSIGSFTTWKRYFRDLCEAGGKVEYYHPLRWYTVSRINNRTHRELLIIDGEVGFVGGAGFADHWYKSKPRHPRWRDTMFRVTGAAVSGLQSVFAENWLEASGIILFGKEYFPFCKEQSDTVSLVIDSSPTAGGSTRARMLYQTLLASARESIHITSPYFLPDHSARQEMIRAIKERGVDVKIVTPGKKSDHLLTRRSSRRLYGDLLAAGARIFEYRPSMIHTKCLIVDGVWSVIGSTNFDNRSFGLNDEVNLAAYDRELAARLEHDFSRDVAESEEVTYRKWRRRPVFERLHEALGALIERQQ